MPNQHARYVDGFVLVVPRDQIDAYQKMAREGAKMWKDAGALDYKECMGDDLTPDMGGVSVQTFPQLTNLKADETVWFSFITFTSRAHRDEVNAKVMAMMEQDKNKDMEMPFDMKRMAYGGFEVIVDI